MRASGTNLFVYDNDGNLLAETDADGNILREYVYLDGQHLALFDVSNNDAVFYYINDHLGTAQILLDNQGTVVWQGNYRPFGKVDVVVNNLTNYFRFPGQIFDVESGLHYNWNRYYNPETGRYISADPIGLDGGLNLYAYVANDPVNLSDPVGNQAEITLPLTGLAALPINIPPGVVIAGTLGGSYGATTLAIKGTYLDGGLGSDLHTIWQEWVDDINAQREHDAYKERYAQPPPPGLDPCEELKWKLARAKRLIDDMRRWDANWSTTNRHTEAIRQHLNEIKNLERKIKRVCKEECE